MDSDLFDHYDDSQLDHLVPAQERQEPSVLQQEGPEVLEEDETSQAEKAVAIQRLRISCETVQIAARNQAVWDRATVADLDDHLTAMAIAETPTDDHYDIRQEVITRVDDAVRSGLLSFTGMHVEHYGSFTSGLFTPSGDLDISIEGVLQYNDDGRQRGKDFSNLDGLDVSQLHKDEKAAILRALVKKLVARGISVGRPQGILHARVPIIKFVDARSGIPCDMAVGSGGARFKSTVLHHLSLVDQRFPDLMRIIKLWAKSFSLNDASQGTFNTFALTLMVVFHLQTRSPPILPPICELFGLPADSFEARPLHQGRPADMSLLEDSMDAALQWKDSPREVNTETLLELLSSFFALYSNATAIWTSHRYLRAVRCCTWAGQWTFKPWPKVYMMPIEDPFDATDNCARSIFAANAEYVSKTLQESLMATQRLNSASVLGAVMEALFARKPEPYIRHPFAPKGSKQGWNEGGWGKGKAANAQPTQRSSGLASDGYVSQQDTQNSQQPTGFPRSSRLQAPPGFFPTHFPHSQAAPPYQPNGLGAGLHSNAQRHPSDPTLFQERPKGGTLWEPGLPRPQRGGPTRHRQAQQWQPPPPPQPPSHRHQRDYREQPSRDEPERSYSSEADLHWHPPPASYSQLPPGFQGSNQTRSAGRDQEMQESDLERFKGLFANAALRHKHHESEQLDSGRRDQSLAAMLPDSLSLDATPSEDSPQRQGRPRRSNGPQQGRSEGSYKPNAGYRGPGNRYNRNPREKPKVIMVPRQQGVKEVSYNR